MRKQWLRVRRIIVHNVLHADDTPHAIALGVAIAVFIAILPVIGLQTIISLALAAVFRANKAVCIPIVWISNPLTAIPIYYPCLLVGRFVRPSQSAVSDQEIFNLLTFSGVQAGMFQLQFWKNWLSTLAALGVELWVGSCIVAAVLAIVCYPLARWGVVAYRRRHRHRLLRRDLFRAHTHASKLTGETEAA